MSNTLQIGQTLYFVPRHLRDRRSENVTVEKIGRKWATLSNRHRIDIETLVVDGGEYSSPGRCYLSKDEYEAESALQSTWNSFKREIERQSRIPGGVTVERIAEARKLLNLV